MNRKHEHQIYQDLQAIHHKLVKQAPLPDDSTERWVKEPETVTYSVSLVWTQVHDMAIKAAGNKSGRSKLGPVIVRITGRKDGMRLMR